MKAHASTHPQTHPTRRRLLLGAASAGALAAGWPRNAAAQLKLDVTQGTVQPLPIALPDFVGGDGDLGRNITQIITSNLRRSGLFAPIDQAAYLEKITNPELAPKYPDWRVINAQHLVTGRLSRDGGRLKAEVRLWDILPGKYQWGQQYSATPDN